MSLPLRCMILSSNVIETGKRQEQHFAVSLPQLEERRHYALRKAVLHYGRRAILVHISSHTVPYLTLSV